METKNINSFIKCYFTKEEWKSFSEKDFEDAYKKIEAEQNFGVSYSLSDLRNILVEAHEKNRSV